MIMEFILMILTLAIGLGVMNFSIWLRFYLYDTWSNRAKIITYLISNTLFFTVCLCFFL